MTDSRQPTRVRARFILGFILLLAANNWTPLFAQVHSFPNEPGWAWQVTPRNARFSSSSSNNIVLMLSELKNGETLLTMAYSDRSIPDVFSFKAVGFDELNRRYEFEEPNGGGSSGVFLSAFRLPVDRLPKDKLKYVGIEKLTTDSLRLVISPNAIQKLKEQGEQELSYPELGKPYNFQLKTADGSILRSKDFLGKVILLDFWASWCSPCMAKMPRLKETYHNLSGKGFEVIGINHDNSLENANRVLSKEKLPWPEVLAPMGEDNRKLWNVAAGITSLPRLWLIDRKGVLRADVSVPELEGAIQRLVNE
jgi:thiol-disulfide isomerase/thioredoxin